MLLKLAKEQVVENALLRLEVRRSERPLPLVAAIEAVKDRPELLALGEAREEADREVNEHFAARDSEERRRQRFGDLLSAERINERKRWRRLRELPPEPLDQVRELVSKRALDDLDHDP